MPRVVLITGVSHYLGARLAAQLAADPSIDRVIGVDPVAPKRHQLTALGRTEFVRMDHRSALIATLISRADVDTVVHTSVTATRADSGRRRRSTKELNVFGTMQLLGACQRSDTVGRVVLKSSTAVYGSSPRDPAVSVEDMAAKAIPRVGHAKDTAEVEGYARAFARRRPDIATTVLRLANVIGPGIDSPLTRYLTLPVVPTSLGFDPRLQLLHEDDAVEVLRLSAMSDRPGSFNVAGSGQLLLSQMIRRAGRVAVPVPSPLLSVAAGVLRRTGIVNFSREQLATLSASRVVDTTRLATEFGYRPRYTTATALQSFCAARQGVFVERLAPGGRLPVGAGRSGSEGG